MYWRSFHSQHHVLFNCLSSMWASDGSAFAGTYRDVCVWTKALTWNRLRHKPELLHRALDENECFCAAGWSERDRHRRPGSSRPGQYGLMFTICSDRSRSFSFTHKHTSFFFKWSQSHTLSCVHRLQTNKEE